ncbi:hypothetical protein J2Z69_003812 [Paenibacillus shirakamiensis]|uniref:Uncharacterized protein n=1 Tax=Paenibacillus shirakamiensis TaxID=1265935 RepID=A0ABS4JLW3_9BACL|nr:hypothetical protein [Paenibacillus shirakamiensis]MBP2002703.1 hypothetical protein [Paenibacillus shirakamiensis]
MQVFGAELTQDSHFQDHLDHAIPVQVYRMGNHVDIGWIKDFDQHAVLIGDTLYKRSAYVFTSRPGY